MIMLPRKLHQAIRASQGQPVRLADPETNVEYVVPRADFYDQMPGLCDEDAPPDER